MTDDRTTADIRTEILREAAGLISGDREAVYGPPADNFRQIAAAWSACFGWPVSPEQVPQAQIIVKLVRLQATPAHRDSYVDIAGYAALAGEVSLTPSDDVKVSERGLPNDFKGYS